MYCRNSIIRSKTGDQYGNGGNLRAMGATNAPTTNEERYQEDDLALSSTRTTAHSSDVGTITGMSFVLLLLSNSSAFLAPT